MSSSNIKVTHADSGLVQAEVLRTERISPHVQRVTLTGEGLAGFSYQGFDHWCRLAIPVDDDTRYDNMPDRFGMSGYLRYLTLAKKTRPVIRNYTFRGHRPASAGTPAEIDIDFVLHGTTGVAGPWSQNARPGSPIGFIDQGCGWRADIAGPASDVQIVADETGMPAALGILSRLGEDVTGTAIIELPDDADAQPVQTRSAVQVRWVTRPAQDAPGRSALAEAADLPYSPTSYVFAVGAAPLATGVRRLAVRDHGMPKEQVTFCGYYKLAAH